MPYYRSYSHTPGPTIRLWLFPLALLLFFMPSGAYAESSILRSLFGATATQVQPEDQHRIKEWKDWQNLLKGMSETDTLDTTFSNMPGPRLQQWRAVLKQYPTKSSIEKLRLISGFFNNWRSASDMVTYGQEEYWATAAEFLEKGQGDCEDFVIIKYQALRLLGWDPASLWIVLVNDTTRTSNHAVLAAKMGADTFILDNLSSPGNLILKEEKYSNLYTPLAAMNSHGIWLFTKNGTATAPFTPQDLATTP